MLKIRNANFDYGMLYQRFSEVFRRYRNGVLVNLVVVFLTVNLVVVFLTVNKYFCVDDTW